MKVPADVVLVSEMVWEDETEGALYQPMVDEARVFLEGFRWCREVRRLHGGVSVPKVVAVFLAEITPAESGVDECLWVVVGDLPPAYLVLDNVPSSVEALRDYVGLMRDWVKAVGAGEPVDDLIPVNVEPTREWAERLASRLDILESVIEPLTVV